MTPNADRFTLPSSDLIVHGRIVHPVRATCNCTRQLADALEASIEAEHDAERRFAAMLEVEASLRRDLEASQAQAARLSAIAKAAITHLDGTTVSGDLRRALANRDWPADLLEAVQETYRLAEARAEEYNTEVEVRAVLVRYGLLEEAR